MSTMTKYVRTLATFNHIDSPYYNLLVKLTETIDHASDLADGLCLLIDRTCDDETQEKYKELIRKYEEPLNHTIERIVIAIQTNRMNCSLLILSDCANMALTVMLQGFTEIRHDIMDAYGI